MLLILVTITIATEDVYLETNHAYTGKLDIKLELARFAHKCLSTLLYIAKYKW